MENIDNDIEALSRSVAVLSRKLREHKRFDVGYDTKEGWADLDKILAQHITAYKIAKKVGVSYMTVYAWKKRWYKPTYENCIKLGRWVSELGLSCLLLVMI